MSEVNSLCLPEELKSYNKQHSDIRIRLICNSSKIQKNLTLYLYSINFYPKIFGLQGYLLPSVRQRYYNLRYLLFFL
jgi:hypothetical protein